MAFRGISSINGLGGSSSSHHHQSSSQPSQPVSTNHYSGLFPSANGSTGTSSYFVSNRKSSASGQRRWPAPPHQPAPSSQHDHFHYPTTTSSSARGTHEQPPKGSGLGLFSPRPPPGGTPTTTTSNINSSGTHTFSRGHQHQQAEPSSDHASAPPLQVPNLGPSTTSSSSSSGGGKGGTNHFQRLGSARRPQQQQLTTTDYYGTTTTSTTTGTGTTTKGSRGGGGGGTTGNGSIGISSSSSGRLGLDLMSLIANMDSTTSTTTGNTVPSSARKPTTTTVSTKKGSLLMDQATVPQTSRLPSEQAPHTTLMAPLGGGSGGNANGGGGGGGFSYKSSVAGGGSQNAIPSSSSSTTRLPRAISAKKKSTVPILPRHQHQHQQQQHDTPTIRAHQPQEQTTTTGTSETVEEEEEPERNKAFEADASSPVTTTTTTTEPYIGSPVKKTNSTITGNNTTSKKKESVLKTHQPQQTSSSSVTASPSARVGSAAVTRKPTQQQEQARAPTLDMADDDALYVSNDTPRTPKDGSLGRMGPVQALETYSKHLTKFERKEIYDFDDIYYVGMRSIKTPAPVPDAPNFGYDDERGDYIVVMGDHMGYQYEVLSELGKGSFGQVLKVFDHKRQQHLALKIIRNKKRFHQQAAVEIKLLDHLRTRDPDDRSCTVRMIDYFKFRSHMVLLFEIHSMNLYELTKLNKYQPFAPALIKRFTAQILVALSFMWREQIVHCDLKPENILLKYENKTSIKVIDFGSSCFETERIYTYIQSRFYRAPEIIFGLSYGRPIDLWSLGCIICEMQMGFPIFPGESEKEQLLCVMEVLGVPPSRLIEKTPRRKDFFDSTGQPKLFANSRNKVRKPGTKDLMKTLRTDDSDFVDFILGFLQWDPAERMTPNEAMRHPWIGECFHQDPSEQRPQSSRRAIPGRTRSISSANPSSARHGSNSSSGGGAFPNIEETTPPTNSGSSTAPRNQSKKTSSSTISTTTKKVPSMNRRYPL